MQRLILAIAVVMAALLPSSVALVATAGPAAASGSSISCKGAVGVNGYDFAVWNCTPRSKSNNTAQAAMSSLLGGTATFTWTPSLQTTTATFSLQELGQGVCKRHDLEVQVTGTVTGGTSTYTNVGDAISGLLCLNGRGPNGATYRLVKGTTFDA